MNTGKAAGLFYTDNNKFKNRRVSKDKQKRYSLPFPRFQIKNIS